LRWWHKN